MKGEAQKRHYVQGARADAAEATGQRIVRAFLSLLMQHWFDEITLDRVAHDAQVTAQTIVRRFGGKDGLLAVAVEHLAAQINVRRQGAPGDVRQMVSRVVDDYEITGDAVLRLLALESRHPAVRKVMDYGRHCHRAWVAAALPSATGHALDGLVLLTDVYAWKLLRRDMGHGVAATKAILKNLADMAYEQREATS
ncbi:MAG TPA: TetR/AcrR family transcriptional regulator [Candidatus Xenobia bacterium]|jgi:AcrR family transcriptional regulator